MSEGVVSSMQCRYKGCYRECLSAPLIRIMWVVGLCRVIQGHSPLPIVSAVAENGTMPILV